MTATAAVWVALSCCRIRPRDTSFFFGPLKQHLAGCRLHSNGEVEMAVRDWLRVTIGRFITRSRI
jgi:hypothetical protein